jgi:hypothetical protein
MRCANVPASLLVLAAEQAGLVSGRQCDLEGFGKDRRYRLVASGRALAPAQGVVDLEPTLRLSGMQRDVGPDHDRRRAAFLALLAHGQAAVAVGQSALALLGVQGLPRLIPSEVAMPAGSPRVRRGGIVVRNFRGPIPTVRRGDFRVASPAWALAQAVCELDRDHAIAVLDSAIQRGLIRPDELPVIAGLARGRRGAGRLHSFWELVDGRSQSPLETWVRLQCHDAGVPPDDLQVPIRDARGRLVARGDLGWRLRHGRWLVAEIDGAGPHSEPRALYGDRERQNEIQLTRRVDLLRFTARDAERRERVPTLVKAHLALDAAAT